MRDRLGHGKAPFVRRQTLDGEDAPRDLEDSLGATADGFQRMLQTQEMMGDQLFNATAPIGDQPLMPG